MAKAENETKQRGRTRAADRPSPRPARADSACSRLHRNRTVFRRTSSKAEYVKHEDREAPAL